MTDKTESLKAFDPASLPKAEKYGMPIEYAHRIVQRHFGLTSNGQALEAGKVAADIGVRKALAKKD